MRGHTLHTMLRKRLCCLDLRMNNTRIDNTLLHVPSLL